MITPSNKFSLKYFIFNPLFDASKKNNKSPVYKYKRENHVLSLFFFFYHMIDPLVNEFFSLIVLESMFMFKGELYEPIQLIAKQY